MRRAAQEGPYCPDGDSALMVLPLRRQDGNIWNRSESHVPVTGWTATHDSRKHTHTHIYNLCVHMNTRSTQRIHTVFVSSLHMPVRCND